MKKRVYFLALFLFFYILISCTPDDSVELGIQAGLEENIANGEEDTPRDKGKN